MTKLHKTTTALILAAALLLSGCAEQRNSPAQGAENTISDSNSFDSTEIPDSGSPSTNPENSVSSNDPENSSDSDSEPDLQTLIERFPIENVGMPGGNTVSKYEASSVRCDEDGNPCGVEFDFAYVSYARPIFHSTFDDPELFDPNTLEFKGDPTPAEDLQFFQVRAGDKLKNGLVIKSANHSVSYANFPSVDIEFDGQITLEGVLFCYDSEFSYNNEGYLHFWPDTTKYDSFPIVGSYSDDGNDIPINWIDIEEDFAFVGGEAFVWFRNYDSIDLSDIISPGEYLKVNITIKDLSSSIAYGLTGDIFATLVSVEPI